MVDFHNLERGKLILDLGFVIFFFCFVLFSCLRPKKILTSSLVGMYLLLLLSVMLLHVIGNLEEHCQRNSRHTSSLINTTFCKHQKPPPISAKTFLLIDNSSRQMLPFLFQCATPGNLAFDAPLTSPKSIKCPPSIVPPLHSLFLKMSFVSSTHHLPGSSSAHYPRPEICRRDAIGSARFRPPCFVLGPYRSRWLTVGRGLRPLSA